MAQRIANMANRMAIAIGRCHVRDMAHSTPLQTTTRVAQFCGVSGSNRIRSNGYLGSALIGFGDEIR